VTAFTVALAAGEYAIGCGGYVLMFAVRAPVGTRRRWASTLLFAVPVAVYLASRSALGYGAEASGFYQDPLRDTALFFQHAPWRFVSLAFEGWFSEETGDWNWGSDAAVVAVLVVQVLLVRPVLRHVLSRLPEASARTVVTLLWGSVFALLPVLAVLPSARLIGVAMLGIAPVVASILDVAWFEAATEARHGIEEWTAIVATLLGFAHLVHAPGTAWLKARQTKGYSLDFAAHARGLADQIRGQAAPEVVVVRGLDDVFFYGFALEALGVANTHWTVLSHTGHVLALRKDERTLELVVSADSAIYPASFGDLYRSESHPIAAGEAFSAEGFDVTVTEMGRLGPRRARFQFNADLDDSRWVWVGESQVRGFYDAKPPRIGFGNPFDP
jgi:hypothetical protein